MDNDFFLLTTFLLQRGVDRTQMYVRCLGCREVLRAESEIPVYVLGMIEFGASQIPIIDPAAASGAEPRKMDSSQCVLVVEHFHELRRFYAGIIVKDLEEIMKFAAGVFEDGSASGCSANIRFLLEFLDGRSRPDEMLVEAHKALMREFGHSGRRRLTLNDPHRLINQMEKMDFLQRQLLFEELESNPELWDAESKVMCL